MRKKFIKKQNKKLFGIVIALMLSVLSLTGCEVAGIHIGPDRETEEKREVSNWPESRLLTINGKESDYREALIYLLAAKEEAELLYGEGVWEQVLDETGITYGEKRKAQILSEFIDLKIVCAHADDYDVKTYEEENRDITGYTGNFIATVGKDRLLKYNISETVIKTLYTNNTIALKVYEAVTLGVDTYVSDEEARQARVMFLYKSKYTKGADGEKVLLSEEKLEELKTTVQQLRDAASSKKDFKSFAQLNTELKTVERTVGKGDLDAGIEQFVLTLSDDEISPVLETEDGFYIFKCVYAIDEEATQARKEAIVKERQETRFEKVFTDWKNSAVLVIDRAKWESINP